MSYPENNRTWKILHEADKKGYAVIAFNCYNADGILASIKAAEEENSPAMVEIFPWSMRFQGDAFVRFAADMIHNASVPMSLHLDHCTDRDDVYHALTLPFDSIMVDASTDTAEEEESIKFVSDVVGIAKSRNITIEAELGRIQGSEDGAPSVDAMRALYSDPDAVAHFVSKTGVHYLAPSFGNIHGVYPPGGAEKFWQLDRLEKISEALKATDSGTKLVLHGVSPVDPVLIQKTIDLGIRKINLNRDMHVPYLAVWGAVDAKSEMTSLIQRGVDGFKQEARRLIRELGTSGLAINN